MIRKQVKLKKKSFFRRLIKLITSDEDINFSESFYLAVKKKHKRSPKNQNRKENWLKLLSLRGIAMMFYGIPKRGRGIFSMVSLVYYCYTSPLKGATGSLGKCNLNQREK